MPHRRHALAFLFWISAYLPGAARVLPAIQAELPGDVDGDGSLTMEDARLVRDVLGEEVDPPADFERRAEVSGNGAITLVDAELIDLRALGALDRWPVRYGDLDGDLAVDLSDGFAAIRLALGRMPPSFTIGLIADVDGDGEIALVDSSLILAHALGLQDFFPVDPPPPPPPTSTPVGEAPLASATPSTFPIEGTDTPTPVTGAQPDLVVTSMKIELESGAGCYNPPAALGVRVVVTNTGPGEAGHFVVWVQGSLQPVEGLAAGEAVSHWFAGYDPDEATTAIVDYLDDVPESDESNNRMEERLPVPTPPATCTPGSDRTSTPTPIATAGLPDLTITRMEIVYLGTYGCYGTGLGTYVEIANIGVGDAGSFSLQFMEVTQRFEAGLTAWGTAPVWFPYYYFPNSVNSATVDTLGEVPESDEGNNSRAEVLQVPEPPTCTPTPVAPGEASATPPPGPTISATTRRTATPRPPVGTITVTLTRTPSPPGGASATPTPAPPGATISATAYRSPTPKPPGPGTITVTRTWTSAPPGGATATPTLPPTSNPPGGATVSATPYHTNTPVRTKTPKPFPPAGGTATATPSP